MKPGDGLTLNIDTGSLSIQSVNVKSYLESKDDADILDVNFAFLDDGAGHVAESFKSRF